MKSYLRFLSRNKLYTTIEVIGLSIALAFVLILSSYIIEEISTDREVKENDRLPNYVVEVEGDVNEAKR